MKPLEKDGHHVIERGLYEGIVQYVVVEHSDGMVTGMGSHFTPLSAYAEISECVEGRRPASWCHRFPTRIDELASDRAQVTWR